MSLATERVVVQLTAEDKRLFADKAKALNVTLSALVRRAVLAYDPQGSGDALPQWASQLALQQLTIESLNERMTERMNALEAQLAGLLPGGGVS